MEDIGMNTDLQRNSPKALAMLTVSMVVFGSIGIFRRMIPLPSALIAFFRGAIGSLFLIAFLRVSGKKIFHNTPVKTLLLLALSGAVIAFNWILLFEAYNNTTVSVATLCYYMEPVIVILLSAVLFREKLTLKKSICAALAFCGMILVSGVAEGGLPRAGELKGILLGLGAAVLYSAVVLMNRFLRGVDPFEKTIIQLGAAAVVMVPYLFLTGEFTGNTWTFGTAMLLLFVGIVHTGICYALYFGSMDSLRMQTVAIFSYLDPITALFLSALILHERLTVFGIIGAVLILGSAIISEME